ncbi:MAG: Zinc protease insulinase family [Candidatus Giovannonibacteria bacterium GW2011_GWA1_44_29]|uniref:Zinc protease insulinase family n=1 Tax=Candidatus Giovannonibacteria bacterium GW2011_GWA1_44_29 TaxID=1618646 RepID=A0A0G1LWG2_9BACT|nr:MAG: Zinc protease insulinase family [Candidatus Giovannonibacteria bacterium GW2011_GWA1_44_29]
MWALFGTGSKYEIKKNNGISHFLEHLFFKGTKSRPRPNQIARELDRIGAQKNAFTSKEYTGYYVKAAAKYFDVGLDVVSDILLEPLFKKEEIEKERGVILQEIAMYEDNPQRQAYDLFEDLMYGDQPAGWDTAGTPETVSNIKRDNILKYKNSHYLASNAVVAVAGNIDPEVAFLKVERAFKNMPDGRKIAKLKVKERQTNPRVKFKKKDLDQTHLRLGVRAYPMYDERRYALQVLATILGGTWSSYLWREIREKRGLAYYVGASAEEYTDSGYLLTTAGVAHENLPKVVKKIVEIMRHLRIKGVSEKEINFAKEYIRGSMTLAFETTDEVATFLSSQELFYKKIMTPEDILRKIEAVKRSDIIKVARDIFRPEKINLAAIGPHEDGQVYETMLAQI